MSEGLYKLPKGWRWVRLGEICQLIETGFAFRKKGVRNGNLLHLRPYNISEDGTLDLSEQFLIPLELAPTGPKMFQPGDVLFNNTNSVELVGKTALVTQPLQASFSNHITLLRTRPDQAQGGWLALALRAMWQKGFFAERCHKWIGQAGISTATLKTFLIPLPPLEEQRRIVARIEELMARVREAKRLREEAKQDTERLMQATLAEVFPRPGSNLPKGWQWVRLGEIAEKPQYGYTSSALSEAVGPKFLRITDITSGVIDWDSVPHCKIDAKEFKKYQLKPNDLLFARSGSIGTTILIKEVPYEAVFASYLIRVRVRAEALPEFVSLILKAPSCQKQFIPLGAAQKNINAKAIQQILIPLPPLEEQRRIVAYLEAVQERVKSLRVAQEATEAELQRLEQAILNKAFRGEL